VTSGIVSITSTRYFFWSDISDHIGGADNLPCFLSQIGGTMFGNSTLVLDGAVVLNEPLILPSRFPLAGVGIEGEGRLSFPSLPAGAAGIQFAPGAVDVTIRDLAIGGPGMGDINAGIDLSGASEVYIRDVLISNFYAGVYGARDTTSAISVHLNRCEIFHNVYNIAIHRHAFHWRIRDCQLNGARCWAIRIFGSADDPVEDSAGAGNDYLIAGCRIEGAGFGGVRTGADSTILMNNRFEQNGGEGGIGILALPTATNTRLVSNYLASNAIVNLAEPDQTQCWGTIISGLPNTDPQG
jgi:Periplasmic copper-binding protein (NosD)